MSTKCLVPLLLVTGCGQEPDALQPLLAAQPPVAEGEKLGKTSVPLWRPDYQLPFYRATHVKPTEESRAAAWRQFKEVLEYSLRLDADEVLVAAMAVLPDGRFSAGGISRTQAIGLSLHAPVGEFRMGVNLYSEPSFRGANGERVPNPTREVWYSIQGEKTARRVSEDARRYFRVGDRVKNKLPGQPGYEQLKWKSSEEAFGMPPNPPPSEFTNLLPGQ